ncbi:MAG TPA: hypothetical protein VGJ41_06480 [Nocardioides sp.]
MSDPTRDAIRQLENFTEGLTVNPLAPSEVRRQGDRLRRRNTVVGAVAAAAVVAVVAAPFVLLDRDGGDDSLPLNNPSGTPSQSVSESPSDSPVTEIPDDFPLAAGWPDPSQSEYGDKALEGPSRTLPALDITACGHHLPDLGNLDRLDATWKNVEDYRSRELLTFGTAQEAVTYVAHLRAIWMDCPSEDVGDGQTAVHELRPTQVGGESVALVTSYEMGGAPAIGLSVDHVIRLGRSVLVDTTSTEGTKDGLDQQLAEMTDETAPVVAAMCLFTKAGCGTDSAAPSDDASAAGSVLGPDGYGDLRLGMTAAEVEDTGLATLQPFADPGANCRTMSIHGWGDTVHPNFSGTVHGLVSRNQGLAIIIAQPDMHTTEGIGVGSTVQEIRDAYGELTGSDAYSTQPVDGIRYFFLTDGSNVTAFQLELADQDCFD